MTPEQRKYLLGKKYLAEKAKAEARVVPMSKWPPGLVAERMESSVSHLVWLLATGEIEKAEACVRGMANEFEWRGGWRVPEFISSLRKESSPC